MARTLRQIFFEKQKDHGVTSEVRLLFNCDTGELILREKFGGVMGGVFETTLPATAVKAIKELP